MALIDREYMRRDVKTGSHRDRPSTDVQRLLETVKPAKLVPAIPVPIALIIGMIAGAAGTYLLLPVL